MISKITSHDKEKTENIEEKINLKENWNIFQVVTLLKQIEQLKVCDFMIWRPSFTIECIQADVSQKWSIKPVVVKVKQSWSLKQTVVLCPVTFFKLITATQLLSLGLEKKKNENSYFQYTSF